jgi:hypothetical protein
VRSQVLKYAKRGDFEKCCEFHKHRRQWNKVPKLRNRRARRNSAAPTVKQQLVSPCQRLAGAKSNACARKPKTLERAFEVALVAPTWDPPRAGVRAAHLRSRIPAMALT